MKSFAAQIIYSIECEGKFTDQYKQLWRLVYAGNEKDAIDEARQAGYNEQTYFTDTQGRNIFWRMLAVKELRPLELVNRDLLHSIGKDGETISVPVWAGH